MILIEEEEGVVMLEGRRETISHEGLTLISRNACVLVRSRTESSNWARHSLQTRSLKR